MKPLPILLPVAWCYETIIRLRNMCYDRGIFKTSNAGIPVISVGNITAGGTGKTPFVEYLVRYFIGKGKRVAVISRGYKREGNLQVAIASAADDRGNAMTLGDEPYQIARKFPEVILMVDADRVRAAHTAVGNHHAEVIILDDGFQHRKIARDLDIVLIDGKKPLQRIQFLPAGEKREPVSSLKRASLIAFNGGESGGTVDMLASVNTIPSINITYRPKRICPINLGKEMPPYHLKGKKIIAFCGIGNPESFSNSLKGLGAVVVQMIPFADHHSYIKSDVEKIANVYRHEKADYIITTEKDAVRLDHAMREILPTDAAYYLEIETVITKGEKILESMLEKFLKTC
ncbi:MAG: tetraacyldisaccharide 4'-kinase [Bacteroidota bacterium]